MSDCFVVPQKEIVTILSSMQPICSKRSTVDTTEYILFQVTPRELILKATDLEISLRASIPLERNDLDQVSFLVAGKRIFELVRELDGDIEFRVERNQLKLTSKGVKLSLNIRDAQDFPPFPERIENLMELDAPFLLKMLGKVSFLIPQSHSNAALNAMQLEFTNGGMSMVATDGHSLALVNSDKYSLPENKQWLLPRRAILEIKKILETKESAKVFLGLCGNQLVFSGENFNFFSKVLTEKFPEYQAVLDKNGFRPARLARDEMLKALKRANCLLVGQFLSTKFEFKGKTLDMELENKEVGNLKESLGLVDFEGDSVESRFYTPYLLNGLSVFPEKEVSFSVHDGAKPIIFESSQDEYHFTYLVMPISASYKTS